MGSSVKLGQKTPTTNTRRDAWCIYSTKSPGAQDPMQTLLRGCKRSTDPAHNRFGPVGPPGGTRAAKRARRPAPRLEARNSLIQPRRNRRHRGTASSCHRDRIAGSSGLATIGSETGPASSAGSDRVTSSRPGSAVDWARAMRRTVGEPKHFGLVRSLGDPIVAQTAMPAITTSSQSGQPGEWSGMRFP